MTEARDPGLRLRPGKPPWSECYGDHYYSRHGGLAETRHVFLAGNDLPHRWRDRESFTIGETGFGTGLNFLATWQCWADDPRRCRRLHYLGVERHPLSRAQLRLALADWPELADRAAELIAAWPEPVPGWHRLWPGDDAPILTLLFGDAATELARLDAAVDAWYLDGFAPARNPAMWSPELLREVARCTAPGGTAASYTVAGTVRRALSEAGFAIDKRPGFGGKREMLSARLPPPFSKGGSGGISPPSGCRNARKSPLAPLFQRGESVCANSPAVSWQGGELAIVIGAGLAGCATAHGLARRGWTVTLLERHAGPALEASGNPAGVVMPRPEVQPSPAGSFHLHAWLHALHLLERFAEAAGWRPGGVLQLAVNERRIARYPRFIEAYGLPDTRVRWLSADETATVAGIPLDTPALYYPGSGWLVPAGLCRALIDRPAITLHTGVEVADIDRTASGWRVADTTGAVIAEAPVLVLANALAARRFLPWLPLIPARGQLSRIDADPVSARLRTVLYGKGYVIPAHDGRHVIGASLVSGDADPDLRTDEDAANLARLKQLLPDLARARADTLHGAFAAVRATTPDRLPLIGAVPDASAFRADSGRPARGRRRVDPPPPLPGLYLLSGLGTRGVTSAPLAAELLASLICHEPLPLARELVAALDPVRFLLRERKRRMAR